MNAAFLEIVRPYTAGDPMKIGARWTNRSLREIAAELKRRGFRVRVPVVRQLLHQNGLGRRQALKKRSFKHHPHRDPPFENSARLRALYESAGNPIFSIDTQKKELIGDWYRDGRAYTEETIDTLDHDFPSSSSGAIYPHCRYDLQRNHGHIHLGISHDTSAFACDSIAFGWEHYGHPHYPQATSLLLLCDGGGRNSASRYVFKYGREPLADRIGLEIRVAHDPPYKSKYHPIEHRFFPHVTRACQGVIFTSVATAIEPMAKTRTNQGLTSSVPLLKGEYPTGEKAPQNYKKNMRIVFDEELPKWNYRAIPSKKGSYTIRGQQ